MSRQIERRVFGSELIERQWRHDLGGTFEVDFNESGLRSRIDLPLNVLTEHSSNQKDSG
ncbi:hypothetical protein [Falsiroseomonas sp. E2-1-a20]|uniref:hypothetical protein n=1 Tax=Falsiroseomonas sp. E2-1-a20 TaxID=3239300 RepID=UPI003F305CD5